MALTIAVSGKGGCGKTTLAAMMIKALVEAGNGPVLAVDADPNACLALTLGVETLGSISDLREQARSKTPTNAGADRLSEFQYGLNSIITEAKGFDLVTMGRPEGPSCYCAANNLLRRFLDDLSSQYAFVVLDNEAGMEHLSRRTTNNVDLLCMVSQPSPIGRTTAQRIAELTKTLPIAIKRSGVVWSRTDTAEDLDGIETLACVPEDPAVLSACMEGRNIFEVEADSPAQGAVSQLLRDTSMLQQKCV
jgi:CO dehydrogenase maturation factor